MGCQEQAGAAPGVPTASAPEYQLEEMTFQMEDEKIPEYKPPKSDDEVELPDNDGTEDTGEPPETINLGFAQISYICSAG